MGVVLAAAIFAASVLTIVTGRFVIDYLIKLKMRQTERPEGVQSHLKKQGTPTMGGIMMIISFNVVMLYFAISNPSIFPILILADGFAAIGFVDDYLKVILKSSDGFKPKQKLAAQLIVTSIFAIYLYLMAPWLLFELKLPFAGIINIGFWAVPLLFFAVLGTVNAVNFTDGVDGLASSVTIIVAAFYMLAALILDSQIAVVPAALIGVLLGFLFYNRYPARIFMGDTGSLFLGGLVVALAYMMRLALFIPIVGLIYLIEILSVVLQVSYFKLTKGKRIFKMTPIHHHFELCNWNEIRIVAIFTAFTAAMAVIGYLGL